MTLYNCLTLASKKHPRKQALHCRERDFTYREVKERVDRLGNALKHLGMEEGDRVAVILPNCHRFLEAYFAAAGLGAVLVPLNTRLSAREVALILGETAPKVLITDDGHKNLAPKEARPMALIDTGEYEAMLARSPAEPLGDTGVPDSQLAQLYYTSGTTGRFKGVMLTHGNVLDHALGTIEELALTGKDVWLHAAPMFHLADAWAVWAITMVGGTHVMLPAFEPGNALKRLSDRKVTLTNLIPTMLNLMVKHPEARGRQFPELRALLSGGAPIAPDVVRRIISVFGCDYIQTYGLTETSPFLTMSILKEHLKGLPEEERFRYVASTGRAVKGVSLKIVDDQGREVEPGSGQVGEILARGRRVTPGYWKRPGETAAAIRDGWLHTGDLAIIDEEGYLTIVDRKKDVIITGGENVYSTEVENALYGHPAVLEAAVIGVPDELWGERVLAAVVLRPGMPATAESLITHCRSQLAHFKSPRDLVFLDALPRTGSGKIYKKGLREQLGMKRIN